MVKRTAEVLSVEVDELREDLRELKKELMEEREEKRALKADLRQQKNMVDALERSIIELRVRLESLEGTTKKTIETAVEDATATYAEKLKKDLPGGGGDIVTLKEVSAINDRRFNLVIRGIAEGKGSPEEKRLDDANNMVALVSNIAPVGVKEEFRRSIVSSRRLGKEGEKRPILVRLKTQQMRDTVLSAAREKLRVVNQKDPSRRFRIEPDLSRAQMDELNKAHDEARRRSVEEAKKGFKFFVVGREAPRVVRRQLSEDEKPTAMEEAEKAVERAKRYEKKN